jgi:DnaJ-class molecular chaperone
MNNDNLDLYNILNLTEDSSNEQIKYNFKKLALKYHPDKNKSNDANEKFNQIRIAYEILSDPVKKQKYDMMVRTKKCKFTETIMLFIKEITNPKIIQNLLNRPDIMKDIKDGNIHQISQKIIQKILDNIDVDIDINKLNEIFINSPSQNSMLNDRDKKKTEDSYDKHNYDTSDFNTLNICSKVKVSLDDIYHNRLKEIIIKRKVITNGQLLYDTNSYYIPLYDEKVIINEAGDKVITDDKTEIGNVILLLNCKKDKSGKIEKKGYDIIYNSELTLYELFNGFNKNIDYFNTELNIKVDNPLKTYNFDGEKITVIIKSKGLPFNQNGNRGDLHVNFHLIKSSDFNEKIKNIC